jgi:hypothetical protein
LIKGPQSTLSPALELVPSGHIRIGSLDTLAAVRHELEKVYKDARRGKIHTQSASRLAFILSVIGRTIEQADIEKRLEALERGLASATSQKN